MPDRPIYVEERMIVVVVAEVVRGVGVADGLVGEGDLKN